LEFVRLQAVGTLSGDQMKKLMIKALLLTAACIAVQPVLAQSTTQGAIVGTVFDSSSAVVPNATILIRNNGTNAELKLTSDSAGLYRAPQLIPGTYTVTISAPGFSDERTSNVTVEVSIATSLDVHLKTGAADQIVDVTASAPVLNFEDPTYGGHLSNVEIESIPINNRRWSTLALLTPGATVDVNGFGLIQFRAISPLLNNVEIDGADDNQGFYAEERGRTREGYSTSQASLREFTVNSGVYSAEYGRAVGGVINSVTKSGANQLHGELYFYNRDSSRSAFGYQTNNTTFDATTGKYVTAPFKPSDKRNQYGFGAGGALIKDKLFWFYSFDTFHRNFPGVAKANNPSAFFTAPDAALPAGQTCNTTTGTVTGSGSSTIDQQTCLLAARLGVSYATGAADYNQQLQNALADLGTVPRFGNQGINTPKLDYQINGKNHVSFLYHRLRWDSPGGVQTSGTAPYAVDAFGTDFVKLDYGLVELESLVGRFSNELRYQYGRELNDEGRQTPSSYTNNFLTPTNSGGVPVAVALYTTTGFTAGTPYYSFRTSYPDERKWQVGDTAATTFGRHSIKFGIDLLHNYDLQNNLYEGNGQYNYTSNIVNYFSDLIAQHGTCNSALSGVGNLPCYNSYYQGFGPSTFDLSTLDYGFFVQDDWKVTPRLTVNLGVRYDYESLPGPFNAVPNASSFPQSTITPSDKNNIGPRVGFAYDPYGLGKTVLRGGFGMYYGRIPNAMLLNARYQTGAANTQLSTTYTNSTSINGVSIAPTFPNIASVAPAAAAGALSVQYLDRNLQNPMTYQFDMAVQQDLGSGYILSVSYIGALGRELPNYLNLNLDPTQTYTFNYVVAPAANTTNCGPATCGTVIPTKVYSTRTQTASCAAGASCTGTYSPNTLNKAFSSVTDVISNINSSYNGLTAEIQKRANKVFSFDVNYTWSHALDFAQNASTQASTNGWFDPYGNARANYGNSNYNIPQRLVAWGLLNFPGVNNGSALKWIANGWSLKPLLQTQSGLPYSLTVGGTTPNQCYYTAGCLQAAGSGLSGTGITPSYIPQIGRNTFKYPQTVSADLRAEKDFTFAEKYNLQLIGEAFNLPNHLNITGVTTQGYTSTVTQGSPTVAPTANLVFQPTFQSITSANSNYAYSPRQIQLALRLLF
jgi:outer membrane receptor protein involved in Fe transport